MRIRPGGVAEDFSRASTLTPTYGTAMGYLPIPEILIYPLSLSLRFSLQKLYIYIHSFVSVEHCSDKSVISLELSDGRVLTTCADMVEQAPYYCKSDELGGEDQDCCFSCRNIGAYNFLSYS